MNDYYDSPAPSNTIDRLVRMLDEESRDRRDTQGLYESSKVGGQIAHARERLLDEENARLRDQVAVMRMSTFQKSDLERMAETIHILSLSFRDDFEKPVINKIPVIKLVRERFVGLGLKEAKQIVDQWCIDDISRQIDEANAQAEIDREDDGTFEEEA